MWHLREFLPWSWGFAQTAKLAKSVQGIHQRLTFTIVRRWVAEFDFVHYRILRFFDALRKIAAVGFYDHSLQ